MSKDYTHRSLFQKIKDGIQHFSFYNHVASLVAAELMMIIPSPGKEREKLVRGVVDVFSGGSAELDDKSIRQLTKKLLYARAYYSLDYKEFFLFDMDHLTEEERRTYVGWHELSHYYDVMNELGNPNVFEFKEKTYEYFKNYYRRDFLYVDSTQKREAVLAFFRKNRAGIIKPIDSYGGSGVEIIRVRDDLKPEQIWEKVCNRIPFVVEELIHQAPEMNEFYPHAVNTIRYNTFFHNGSLTRLQAVFRIGRGGSVVDNATSGGIYALIDTETGRIKGPARSFRGELFETHPDTGTRFEGNFIPHWEELNSLLEEIVRVVPEQKQVGWDFALSTDGWVMVEGNTTPAMQSFELNHGLRDKLSETFGSVVKMWSSEKR